MGLDAFRAYWRNVHGPLAATIPVMHRYEQNHLAPSTYEKGVAPAYDGPAITWFASTADMKRGTATPNMRRPAPTSCPTATCSIVTGEHRVV